MNLLFKPITYNCNLKVINFIGLFYKCLKMAEMNNHVSIIYKRYIPNSFVDVIISKY